MGQGDYTHPSYLTRQQIGLGKNSAAANTQTVYKSFLSAMRFRAFTATVTAAGTSTGATLLIMNGTATQATITLGTSAIGSIVMIPDQNFTLPVGTTIGIKTGPDATVVADIVGESYIDPSGSWTGAN